MNNDPALQHTEPETRGVCGFCGKEEGGYAAQKNGKWVAACWDCVKPTQPGPPQKRNPVGSLLQTAPEEDKNT